MGHMHSFCNQQIVYNINRFYKFRGGGTKIVTVRKTYELQALSIVEFEIVHMAGFTKEYLC